MIELVLSGTLENSALLNVEYYVIGLIVTFVIAYVGLVKSMNILTIVAALFAFIIVMAMFADTTMQAYWFFVIVPIAEFLMFLAGMRK